jgi:hypothetical protein
MFDLRRPSAGPTAFHMGCLMSTFVPDQLHHRPRCGFRTWETGVVQYMGNTLQRAAALLNVADALERDPEDGPKNGVCAKGAGAPELSGVVSGIWD